MNKIIFLLLCIILLSCQKEEIKLNSPNGVEFFKSTEKMREEVKNVIKNDFGNLKEIKIKDVKYFEDKVKSIGLVTYEANGVEHSNILFLVTAKEKTSFKCTASSCLCRIDIFLDSNGQYAYECGGCNTDCHWEIIQ